MISINIIAVIFIVHGFEQTAFVSEEGTSLRIPVHLNQKGNQSFSRNQRMIVRGIPETAGMFCYLQVHLTTLQLYFCVIAVWLAGSTDYHLQITGFRLDSDLYHIIVDLKRDHIALEGNETFQLELEMLVDLDVNEFLRNVSSITIVDMTSKYLLHLILNSWR